jgi:hypothetical protein
MAHDVFISFAARDKQAADAVCARVEQAGVRCWIAPRDVVAGSDWAASIVDAIESARVFVLVFSSSTNGSAHVGREVEVAIKAGVIVVPFRIEPVEPVGSIRYFIGSAHWLDAITPPMEAHLATLAATLQSLLDPSTEAQAPVPPAQRDSEHSGGRRWIIPVAALIAVATLLFAFGGVLGGSDGSGDAHPLCDPGIEWHQHQSPYVDGQLVGTPDQGKVAIVFGDARFGFPNAAEYVSLVGDKTYLTITPAEFDAISIAPRDGLLVRERTFDSRAPGRLFLAMGGAVYQVHNPRSLAKIGLNPGSAFEVPTQGLDGTPRIPETGSLLRIGDEQQVWVISGGVRKVASDICPGARINELPSDPHILDEIPKASA